MKLVLKYQITGKNIKDNHKLQLLTSSIPLSLWYAFGKAGRPCWTPMAPWRIKGTAPLELSGYNIWSQKDIEVMYYILREQIHAN